MSKHIDLSPESLPLFVPDVYQKSILDIDYSRLKEKGIEVISFDIDDTIGALEKNYLRYFVGAFGLKKSKAKFEELRQMGFKIVLITNSNKKIAKMYHKKLHTDWMIYEARKPDPLCFEETLKRYKITPDKMAHVGNSIVNDIYGGNRAGITTCLVRRKGKWGKVYESQEHDVGKILEKNDLWRKHHIDAKVDQYYQIGEKQKRICKRS